MKKGAFLLIFMIIFTFSLAGYKFIVAISHPLKYQETIIKYANIYDLSPTLIASIINTESSFNTGAVSNKDAIGLMQIKLTTANYLNDLHKRDHIKREDLFDSEINIEYGCMYLKYLMDRFDDQYTAISAYNAGETRVRTWLKDKEYSSDGITLNNIPYKETRNYLIKIKQKMKF